MKRHVIIMGTGPEITCASPTRHVRIATRKGKVSMDMAPLTCTRQEIDKINEPVNLLLQKLANEVLCTLLDSCAILPQDKPFISYQNNTFLMYDGTHLSSDGSIRLFEILKTKVEKALQQPAPDNNHRLQKSITHKARARSSSCSGFVVLRQLQSGVQNCTLLSL